MTARELISTLRAEVAAGRDFQIHVNAFVDAWRRATDAERRATIADAPSDSGRFEGLVAAIVSALCREVGIPAPPWVETTRSPEPFFALAAQSFALRLRLMLESPAPFFIRNVFVPSDYLSRA